MKIYQTAERESVRSIAEKHAVPERALATLTGLSPRSIVPAGVSLLLPFGARGGDPAGCLYPGMSEERAEILVLGEAAGQRYDPQTASVSGLALLPAGALTRRGIFGMRRAPSDAASLCLPSEVRSECPPPAALADALTAAGYRGLLLPVSRLPRHRLVSLLPEWLAVFAERGLLCAVTLPDKVFLHHLPLFACLDPLPDFICLTPSSWETPLEVRAREISDITDLPMRRRILFSLAPGAAFTTREKSAPLPYGEALRIVSAEGVRLRREDILMAPIPRGKRNGTVYLEDPVCLLAGLMRLSASKFGGVSLSDASAPFAAEMIRRLFRTAGGKASVHWQT